MKIYDILLIIFLLTLSFLPLAFLVNASAKTAVISVDGEHYKTFRLDKDDVFTIKTKYGENTVKIKNNSIAIEYADCADKICVKSGEIKDAGEVIACLPHKLLIEIRNEDD